MTDRNLTHNFTFEPVKTASEAVRLATAGRPSLCAMFLKPLLRNPSHLWTLVNDDTGAVLAGRVHAAVDSASRRRGLLGRAGLDDEALIIAPCNAVHTFFMRFPIDIVYADREGRVTRCVEAVPPWRLSAALRAFATIELAAGTIARTGTRKGHRLEVRGS